jgi:translocation and assembly module TamA
MMLGALALQGCAAWTSGLGASKPAQSASSTTGNPTTTPSTDGPLGVQVVVDAPAPLKALLERYLDVVRLGALARDEVDDTEWSRLIDAAPAQVRELLQTEGYFAPTVTLSRATQRDTTQPDQVRLRVEPGTRAAVSSVRIEAEGELSSVAPHAQASLMQLRLSWDLPVGKDFRNPAWSDAKAAALARLRAIGYATAQWSGTGAEVNAQDNTVRLFLVVDSGPLYRWGSLQLEGLATHDEATVRNLLATQPGEPVTETLLLDFQDRLAKSGLFESVNVTLDLDPSRAGQAAIVARLKESPLQVYTFGLGISANTGPRASVEHLYRRVLGYPASSRTKLELGQKRQALDAEISTHPLAGQVRYLLGGAVERLVSDSDTVLSQRLRLGRTQDKQQVERLHFIEYERSLLVTDAGARNNATALSLNFHGVWRDLDNVILPTRGVTLAVQVGGGQSTGTNASTGLFTRAYGRLTGYLPLGRTWYGQARLELGQVFLRSGMAVPESQKWRAGGDDSVRGYGYRRLGPLAADGTVTSGTALFTASAELARPFLDSMPSLWGAVFVDAGGAANRISGLDPAMGVGVGLRWRSPVGPLRLDYAWGEQTRKTRLHFSVGIAF